MRVGVWLCLSAARAAGQIMNSSTHRFCGENSTPFFAGNPIIRRLIGEKTASASLNRNCGVMKVMKDNRQFPFPDIFSSPFLPFDIPGLHPAPNLQVSSLDRYAPACARACARGASGRLSQRPTSTEVPTGGLSLFSREREREREREVRT